MIKTPRTDSYIKRGIKMQKLISRGYSGLFSYSPEVYDYRTVYDLEEATELNDNGWDIVDYGIFFSNLTLFLWRDIKDAQVSEEKRGKKTNQ